MKHLDPFERGEQLAKTAGAWIVASVETRVFWPKKPQAIEYNGREFLLLPARRSEPPGGVPVDQSPAIAMRADAHRITSQDARVEISRFASVLAWQEGAKLDIVGWSGGNLPRQMGFLRNRGVSEFLDGEFLQVPQTETARAALAFYREGISRNERQRGSGRSKAKGMTSETTSTRRAGTQLRTRIGSRL